MSVEFQWPENELPRRAVVVGINKYNDPEISELNGAENDAEDMYQILKDNGGFEIPQSHYLLGKNATSTAIRRAISDLLWETDECFLSLFYFSGHGIVDSYGKLYLAPCDIMKYEPFISGIKIDELRELISKSKNKDSILLILDCCNSGLGAKGDKSADDTTTRIESSLRETLEQARTGKGKIIMTSSGEDERSRELPRCQHRTGGDPHAHGIYTFHMLEGLSGAAKNEENMITLAGLQKYIDDKLHERGAQKPTSWDSELSGKDFIKIAVASDAFNDWCKGIIEKAEEMYSKSQDPGCLLSGIEKITNVLTKIPTEEQALDLKARFSQLLEGYTKDAVRWLVSNKRTIREKIEPVYDELEKLVPFLNFDQVSELSNREFGLLTCLFDATIGKITKEHFQKMCIPYGNPTSTSRQNSGRVT